MSDTLPEREDQTVNRDFDRCQYDYGKGVLCCTFRNCHGPYMNHRFVEASTNYCNECKGQPHAPWCSEYKEPAKEAAWCPTCGTLNCANPANHQTATSEHQPAARGGGDEWQVGYYKESQRSDGQRIAVINRPHPEGGGEDIAECLESVVEQIIAAHNQRQSLVAERDRLLELLRQVTSATKCYCVTLESGKCWQCQAREAIKQRSTSE